MNLPVYEVYTIKYAEASPQPAPDITIGADSFVMNNYCWESRHSGAA